MNCVRERVFCILCAAVVAVVGCGKSESKPRENAAANNPTPSHQPSANIAGATTAGSAIQISPPEQAEKIARQFGGRMEMLPTGRSEWLLDLSRSKITDADLATLELPAEVVDINLSHTEITDKGLESLISRASHVGRLDLMGTKITDQGLLHLRSMPNLWSVSVEGTTISVEAHTALIEFLAPRLQAYLARQAAPQP